MRQESKIEQLDAEHLDKEQLDTERAILNFWIAMEVLNPQSFADRKLNVAVPKKTEAAADVPKIAPIEFDLDGTLPWLNSAQTPEALGLRADAKDGKDQSLVWQVPLGFIDLEKAGNALSKCFDALADDEAERQRERASGYGVLAIAELDATGRFIDKSVSISSFGWACGMVLSGRRDALHIFPDEEAEICGAIEKALLGQDEKGWKKSTGREEIVRTMKVLLETFQLTEFVETLNIQKATHVIRKVVSNHDGASFSDADIINSFHLRELVRAKEALPAIDDNAPLARYLGRNAGGARPVDPLAEYAVLETLCQPNATPVGRWPSPDPIRLVTLQQGSVNAILQSLKDKGVFAINGPPGTGKTTLLRDLVAEIILQRAHKLRDFDNPANAFTDSGATAVQGNYKFRIQRLSEALRGFGVVVASENNEAVRNISREFPQAKSIRPVSADNPAPIINYFKYLSDGLSAGQDTWGLCAAELGNGGNCKAFVNNVWWKKSQESGVKNGLMVYLKDLFARKKGDGEELFANVDAPRTKQTALSAWRRARRRFDDAVAAAREHQSAMAMARDLVSDGAQLADRAQSAKEAIDNAQEGLKSIKREAPELEERLARAAAKHADYNRQLAQLETLRSGPIRKMFPPQGWRREYAHAFTQSREARARMDDLENQKDALLAQTRKFEKHLQDAQAAAEDVRRDRLAYDKATHDLAGRGLCQHADANFWSASNDAIHMANPWSDDASRNAANEVFCAAIELHKAFIDAARYEIRQNLALIMSHINGQSVSSDAAEFLGDLWDTFFLLTPLYSTTFASAGRMLRGLGPDAIGWLLIDEAGQAAPQSAVGALLRARRAVVIGDPLQIEPVVTLPEGIKRSLANSYNLQAEDWAGEEASCQVLADRVSDYQADIEGARVGFPLLVHRRCDEPMFSISNDIAYGGLMVRPDQPSGSSEIKPPEIKPSEILMALSPQISRSCWLHVETRAKKWSREEGDAAAEILSRLFQSPLKEPDIYFISPFKEVVKGLKETLSPIARQNLSHLPYGERTGWINKRIGTVHTFQGKEAEAVCLVLGASADASQGSRAWAGQSPNILNVAVTRAKRLFIVIGHHDAWRDAGVFSIAADTNRLPRIDYVKGEICPVAPRRVTAEAQM